jgi:hypothetical protein
MAKTKDKGAEPKKSKKASTPVEGEAPANTKKGKSSDSTSAKGGTQVRACHCTNAYQDSRYGAGMRVHNRTVKTLGWRCSACNLLKVS